jgi:hypothetical protein
MRAAAADTNRSRIAPNGGPSVPPPTATHVPPVEIAIDVLSSATDACDTGRRVAM